MLFSTLSDLYCLWKEILSQQRIRHFKILQSIYFAYDVGISSSYSNRIVGFISLEIIKRKSCEELEVLHLHQAITSETKVLEVKHCYKNCFQNPFVNLPRAIVISMVMVTGLYMLTNVAYLSTMSLHELLASSAVGAVGWHCFYW